MVSLITMQTLSISNSGTSCECWVLHQWEFRLCSSFRWCRGKRLNFDHCKCPATATLSVSRCSRVFGRKSCLRNPCYALEYRFFPKHSALVVYVPSGPKKQSLSTSFSLTRAMEEHSDLSDELAQEGDSVCLNNVHSREGQNSSVHLEKNDNCAEEEAQEDLRRGKEDIEDEEGVREESDTRIDVRALARSLRLAKTPEDVEEALKDKGELPLQVYSSMIRGFGKDKMFDPAKVLVEWLKQKKKYSDGFVGPNLFIYNSLLGAVKQAEQFEEAESIMNDMAMEGICPNIVTYNTLMGIYVEQGREVESLELFEEMQKKGLSPSPASYSTALLAYRRLEDGFGALNFYVATREKYQKGEMGSDADEDWEEEFAKLENYTIRICYQVMRRWLVSSENLSTSVLKLLADIDKAELRIGPDELERLVWACTREEHHVVAKEIYNRLRERSSEISLSVCNHVIWLMGKVRKWWAALEIYEDLLDKGPKPNNMSYELIVSHFNILLTAARKKGIWRWGVRLLNKMEEKGLKPGSREWNAVLVACSKASETAAAVQIFRRMVEQGEKPTIISYGALLSALEKGKLYDEALQVWKHMIKVGIEPNVYAYTIMASIYAGQGKLNTIDSIIQEMVSSKMEPTVVTFNAIISGCARNNMGSAAYEWFQRMQVLNVMPNEVTYEMLIEALANDGKPRLAFDMYLRARNEGLNLTSRAYDSVIRSSQVCGATIDASGLGPRPPEKKKKVPIRKTLSEFCNLADVPRRSKPFDRKEIFSQH